ncbi:WW domain-containing oxidoreductase [Cytospora mali]|uniref:WW domain-containing oxidoreductase n=1 Tax=Cytospora mali TaxID=578113 RepID=A0A194V977_CYTMA|nr:WW domain-containing oxidoreductase [Valsa mali var. pyri (nom. inval.)]
MARPSFNRFTTGTEVAGLFRAQIRGKTILVTGPSPNSIGEATAVAIARAGPALLILASRTPSKLEAVADSCRKVIVDAIGTRDVATKPRQGRATEVKTVVLDLGSQASVRSAARQVAAITDRLHVLINNAGISTSVWWLSPDGYEMTFAVNHLGHFLLTNLLLPLILRAGPGARIINVTSTAQRISPMRFSDYNFDNEVDGPKKGKVAIPADEKPNPRAPAWTLAKSANGFPGTVAYGMSKTANVLFTVALKRRLADKGIESFAVHPGEIYTNIATGSLSPEFKREIAAMPPSKWKTPDEGCATTLVAAFDPSISGPGHVYLEDGRTARPVQWASNTEKAERLWQLSEELVAGSLSVAGTKL